MRAHMQSPQCDILDRKMLAILQQDNTTPQRTMGETVNLSAPAVQRWMKRMTDGGVIQANVAIIDPMAVGQSMTIFVEVELVSETAERINHRIRQQRVVRDLAQRGKTSMGWFSGFTRHIVINHGGALLACQLTPGTTDDRRPVPKRAEGLWGRLCADKGYLSQRLTRELLQTRRVRLVTHLKRTMANRLLLLHDKLLLQRRGLLETVFDQLKHVLQIEHTWRRSPTNFAVNLLAGLVAYCHQPNKPSIYREGRPQLTVVIPN